MAKEDKYKSVIEPNLENIGRYIACGVTEEQIYKFYAISKAQWWRYKKTHEEFNNKICIARDKLKADLVSKAYQIAMGLTLTDTKEIYIIADGKEKLVQKVVNKKELKPDAGMIQFLLINRFPEDFARDPQGLEIKRNNATTPEATAKDEKVEGI